jgi:mycothiol synthase
MMSMEPTYTWRPIQYDDIPALYALFLAVSGPEDRIDSLADMQNGFDDPFSDPAVDSWAAFTPSGEMVAYGRCFLHPNPARERVVHLDYELHPAHRRPALEDRLMDWLVARGQARLRDTPADLPRLLRTGSADDLPEDRALLERHGFTPSRYFFRMRRDLHTPIEERPLPKGLHLQLYTPEYSEIMRNVFNEAFKDHWGHEEVSLEDWQTWFVGSDTFRPQFSLLAMAGDEAVGIIFCTVSPDDNARSGRQEANMREIAVLRRWRQRGVASALISESMRRMRAAGLEYASLGVDADNPTGALGVYERLGFDPVRRFTAYERAYVAG